MRTTGTVRLAAAAAIAIITGLFIVSSASAQQPIVRIGSSTIAPGSSSSVSLDAVNIGPPGLGAWEIGVVYDTSILTAVSCSPQQGSVCNTEFAANRVQVVGASANGLDGTNTLANISFECTGEGAAELSLVLDEFSDATTGGPRPINPGVNAGLITCAESGGLPDGPTSPGPDDDGDTDDGDDDNGVSGLPSAGQGSQGGSSIMNWLIAAAASLGLVSLVSVGAARLFAERTDA